MSTAYEPPLDQSLSRFLDGEPEPTDAFTLAAAMGQDAPFAHEVGGLLVVDDLLRQAAEPNPEAFAEAVQTRLAAEADGDRFSQAILHRVRQGKPAAALLLTWLPWAISWAACAVALVGVGWALRGSNQNEEPSRRGEPAPGEAFVALLVNELDAQFAAGAGPDAVRFASGNYRLQSGAVHLRFASGADVVLRGPARFAIHDPLNMTLAEGALRAVVPESAHGFIVRAAGVLYEDWGTEFGVVAGQAPDASQLHVFEGRVDLKKLNGTPLSSVEVGKAVEVVAGEVRPVGTPDPDRFLTPDTIPALKWRRWREQVRTDPSLVCYYPFVEDKADRQVLADDAVQGAKVHGRIHGASWVSGRWPGKQALMFERDRDRVEVEVPGEFRQLTLAAWVKVDRLDFALNAVFNSAGWKPGALHWQLNRSGNCRLGVFPKEGPPQRTKKDLRVPDGQWTHLAAVADLDRCQTRVFLNGQLAAETRFPVPPDSFAPGPCRLGDWLRQGDNPRNPRRGFRGRIDELAFWRRALTPREINEMVTAGRPSLLLVVPPIRPPERFGVAEPAAGP